MLSSFIKSSLQIYDTYKRRFRFFHCSDIRLIYCRIVLIFICFCFAYRILKCAETYFSVIFAVYFFHFCNDIIYSYFCFFYQTIHCIFQIGNRFIYLIFCSVFQISLCILHCILKLFPTVFRIKILIQFSNFCKFCFQCGYIDKTFFCLRKSISCSIDFFRVLPLCLICFHNRI